MCASPIWVGSRGLIHAGVVIAAAALAVGAATGAGGPAPSHGAPVPVNPVRHAVKVVAPQPGNGLGRMARLRVSLPSGTTVALSPLRLPVAGEVTIAWNGRRGVGARGAVVGDGRYVLQMESAAGHALPTEPAQVVVDTTAPRVTVSTPKPTLPAPASAHITVRVRDRAFAGTAPVQVRAIVRTLAGVTLGAGRWQSDTGRLAMPQRVTRSGRAGAVRVTVQARDAAGNRGAAQPRAISLPGAPGRPRVMTHVTTRKRLVALTIDDGYDAGAVLSMIRTATRMKATVTLCVNGVEASGYSRMVRDRLHEATAAGWVQACSHGYSHNTGVGTSQATARRDLQSNVVWDRAAGQSTVPFYRPPYGAVGPGILAAADGLGYRNVLLWDVDTNDWRGRTASQTTAHVLSHARAGSIVLMHAIPSSASALPGIISGLRARGLEPVGVGDLIAAGRPTR